MTARRRIEISSSADSRSMSATTPSADRREDAHSDAALANPRHPASTSETNRASRNAPSIASMRAHACSTSIPTNAWTAAHASRCARSRPSTTRTCPASGALTGKRRLLRRARFTRRGLGGGHDRERPAISQGPACSFGVTTTGPDRRSPAARPGPRFGSTLASVVHN
jgi:hypothetical protein